MDNGARRYWGAFILTAIVCVLFAFAFLVVAFFVPDDPNHSMLLMLIGAIVAKFSDIVSYWTGSSSSSAQKDAVLQQQQATIDARQPPP